MNFNSIRRWIVGAILLLSVYFFVQSVVLHLNDMPRLAWESKEWFMILFTIFFYTLVIGVGGFIWQLLLRDNGISLSWMQLQIIFSISQFGKYLPGNVGHHVGRVYLAKESGVPVTVSIHTMAIEMLYGVGIGSALALLFLLFVLDGNILTNAVDVQPYVMAMLAMACLFLPWLSVRSVNLFFPRLAKKLSGCNAIPEPRFITTLVVGTLFVVCFFIIGLIIKLQADWLFSVTDISVVELTAVFAIAWVAGYLVPGAPAGLGVREALMVLLLAPLVGAAPAVGLSISLRVTTTLGDGLAFLVGLIMRRVIR